MSGWYEMTTPHRSRRPRSSPKATTPGSRDPGVMRTEGEGWCDDVILSGPDTGRPDVETRRGPRPVSVMQAGPRTGCRRCREAKRESSRILMICRAAHRSAA